ncbi:MAG: hypothetical protein RR228_01355 [Bacilli bacterium]
MKKKFMKNKILYILITIVLICFILIGASLVKYFYFGSGESKYGTRLNDIEKHKLPKDIETKISALYKDDKSVNSVKYVLKGKIIYITIDYKEALKLAVAQTTALKTLEAFSKEDLTFYDLQFTLTANTLTEKSDIFPTMGYKNAKSENVSWIRG